MPYTRLQIQFARMANWLGLAPPSWRKPGSSLVILHYHHFTDAPPTSGLEVRASIVRTQLEILSQRFAFCSLPGSVDQLRQAGRLETDRPGVVISIDDAFQSFGRVLPAFEVLRVPVVMFAPIGLCLDKNTEDGLRSWCFRYYAELKPGAVDPAASGQPGEFFDRVMGASLPELRRLEARLRELPRVSDPVSTEKKYSMADLRQLARHPLISLASHSMSHQNLAGLPDRWRAWEIRTAAYYVAELGGATDLFAYPFGDLGTFNGACSAILHDVGVKYACTAIPFPVNRDTPPLLLGRALIVDCLSPRYLWGAAGGALEWWHRARHGTEGTRLTG